MPGNTLSFNDKIHSPVGLYGNFDYSDNKADITRMKKLMRTAIAVELTEKQRYCITEYYYKQRKMKDIATELNVAPSTVTRHIERGLKKLSRVAMYYNSGGDYTM